MPGWKKRAAVPGSGVGTGGKDGLGWWGSRVALKPSKLL